MKNAFVFKEYWKFAPVLWEHAVVVEKRENLHEWNLLNSWVDLRGTKHYQETDRERNEYGHQFGFGVIKHRVVRNPTRYMTYIVIPLFLMVASAFSIFFIDADFDNESDEYQITLEERLSVLVTLLLTVAAFQLQISENLPFKDQYTLIDQYFLMAYLVLFGLIWESSLAKVFVHYAELWDHAVGILLAVLWTLHSLQFGLKWFTFRVHESAPSFCSWSVLSKVVCCGTCGCWKSLKMCLFVSCGGCCRSSKRRERMKRWLRAEMNESASWDWGTTGDEKYAELVIGTDHTMRFEQGSSNGRSYTVLPGTDLSKRTGCVDLRLRQELVQKLIRERE